MDVRVLTVEIHKRAIASRDTVSEPMFCLTARQLTAPGPPGPR